MGSATVTAGVDTWAGSGHPAREHGDDRYLRLKDAESYAFIYLKSPVPRGATVLSATLTVRARGASTGSRTITARRVSATWKASKLNWNNKPGVSGTSATDAVGSLSDAEAITFDVSAHLQAVADGSPHYGWRITTTGTTAHKIYGLNAGRYKPTLAVTWSDAPDAPTTLVPSGAAVSVGSPILTFDYTDVAGSTDLASVQVQIDAGNNFVSGIDFDSGTVASTEPELDLSTTAYAGLADGATTYWRCRVKDAAGLWSDWSDVVSFSRDNQGTLAITSSATVNTPIPTITWSLTGETQAAWQVRVLDVGGDLVYDSGKVPGTATAHTLPTGVITRDSVAYTVVVRTWDAKTRQATPGAPVYAQQTQVITFAYSGTVTGPATLNASVVGATYTVALTFTRATAPDSFVVIRDGVVIEADLDPVDALVSGTTYSYIDHTADPHFVHEYRVAAVVANVASSGGPTDTATSQPEGLWLVDTENDLAVVLWDTGVDGWRRTDQVAVYYPVGASTPVQITMGMQGLSGQFTGALRDDADRTFADYLADLHSLQERPVQVLRLIAADFNIPVVVRNLSDSPHPDSFPSALRRVVSFDFFQAGELAFTPRL